MIIATGVSACKRRRKDRRKKRRRGDERWSEGAEKKLILKHEVMMKSCRDNTFFFCLATLFQLQLTFAFVSGRL